MSNNKENTITPVPLEDILEEDTTSSQSSDWVLPNPNNHSNWFWNPNTRFLRFIISGTIGTILFYILYELLFYSLSYITIFLNFRASIAWAFSYIISIVWQHTLHRYLVFGNNNSYWKTLGCTYVSYTITIALSPLLIYLLVDFLKMDHRIGWIINLAICGVINYVTLKFTFESFQYSKLQEMDDLENEESLRTIERELQILRHEPYNNAEKEKIV